MTDTKDGKDGPREGTGGKRPHATLDLKATEVKAAEDAAGSKTPADADKAAGKGGPQATAEPDKTAGASGSATIGAGAKSGSSAAKPGEKPAPGTSGASAPSKRGSLLTHVVAGLAGAALTLAVAHRFAPELGLATTSNQKFDGLVDQLQQRMATLERAAADQSQGAAAALPAIEERLKALYESRTGLDGMSEAHMRLEADVKTLADKLAAASGDGERIAKLEERFATLAAAAETGADQGRIQGLAALTGKLSDLSDSLDGRFAAERKVIGEAIEQRTTPVAQSTVEVRSAAERLERELTAVRTDAAGLLQRNEVLSGEIQRLAINLEALRKESTATATALSGLDAALKAQFQAVARPADVASAVTPLAGRLEAMEKRIAEVVTAEDKRKSNASRIVLALELANLKRAMERGEPYTRELAEVQKLAPEAVDLGALEAIKDKGVPSLAALEHDFKPVIRSVLDSSAAPAEGSVLDRLAASAKSVIKVRKTSYEADDKSVEAVVGRMETALEAGRLGDVLAISAELPAGAAPAASSWLAAVKARHAADEAIAVLEGELKSSLTGAPPAANPSLQN